MARLFQFTDLGHTSLSFIAICTLCTSLQFACIFTYAFLYGCYNAVLLIRSGLLLLIYRNDFMFSIKIVARIKSKAYIYV